MNNTKKERLQTNTFWKEKEKEFQSKLPKTGYSIIRLDGRAFHTFTKRFERPYDFGFMKMMNDAAFSVMTNVVTPSLLTYVQSDEISIVFAPNLDGHVFSGRIEKIISLSSSAASVGAMKSLDDTGRPIVNSGLPIFDARIIHVETLNDVEEYMNWRRADCRKNAISMAAEYVVGNPKKLVGVSTPERHKLLVGTPFERLRDDFFWGRFITKDKGTDYKVIPATLENMKEAFDKIQ